MPFYRKRPVVIEALRINDADAAREIVRWVENGGGQAQFNEAVYANGGGILVNTSEGSMIAHEGWWVARGTRGEFYPVRPDVFEDVYEAIPAPDLGPL